MINITLIIAAAVLFLITTFVEAQGSWKVVGKYVFFVEKI